MSMNVPIKMDCFGRFIKILEFFYDMVQQPSKASDISTLVTEFDKKNKWKNYLKTKTQENG
jgi:hypothetical protein